MSKELAVNPVVLREEVKSKYRDVAINPSGEYHFHTGRPLARRLGYDSALVDSMPDAAVESFAGVANPFSLRSLEQGEKVLDAGSGGGFDCFVAAHQVGPQGKVIGVDMLPEMLEKARKTAESMGLKNVEFREGHHAHAARSRYGLLTNDSLILAAMDEYGIGYLATRDNDFDHVSELTICKPADI